jgi:transcription elongation factor Elf1
MSSNRSVPPNHPDHDDTLEAHYAALERLENCPHCYGSGVVVLTIEKDGQEYDAVVPCRRCSDSR